MNLSKVSRVALAVLVSSGGLVAADVAPGDVKFQDRAVTTSLTGVARQSGRGRKVFKDRKLGNCLACHANSSMKSELFHGEVGPSLDGVADRWKPERTARHRGQFQAGLRQRDGYARLLLPRMSARTSARTSSARRS